MKLAHEMLHKAERRTATTKTVRETEAEAVAFVVGKAVGLVTGTASADYIQLYHGNASLLAESLEVIQQTSSRHPRRIGASREQPKRRQATEEKQNWRRWRNADHPRNSQRRPEGGTTASTSRSTTRPLWRWSSRRPTSQGRADYPLFPSRTTASRTATPCATRRCASSLELAGGAHLDPFYWRNDYVAVEQWSRNIIRDRYVFLVALHRAA